VSIAASGETVAALQLALLLLLLNVAMLMATAAVSMAACAGAGVAVEVVITGVMIDVMIRCFDSVAAPSGTYTLQ
jgi:hypothetical protein